MADNSEIADLLRQLIETVQPAAQAFADQSRAAAAAEAGAPPGVSSSGGARGAAGKSSEFDLRKSGTFRATTDALGAATSSFQTATSAGAGLGIQAASGILGSGLTQSLLNISSAGREYQLQGSVEEQVRKLAAQNARAGIMPSEDSIRNTTRLLTDIERRNVEVQDRVSKVLEGEFSSGIMRGLQKDLRDLTQAIRTASTLANPGQSGGFFDRGG